MNAPRIAAAAILSALSLAACSTPEDSASLEARLRQATASALATASATEIIISNQTATSASVRWRAATGGKTYDCDADNMLRLPDCRQVS